MQVGPQDRAGNAVSDVHHVVMIVPIDTEVHEAQHVTQQHRNQWRQTFDAFTMWHLHFQDHDGNDDRYDTIKECLHSRLTHDWPALSMVYFRFVIEARLLTQPPPIHRISANSSGNSPNAVP